MGMHAAHTDLLKHVLLPVANADDARVTARALEPYNPEHVTVVHVVEKGGGAIDKTPVSHSEEVASAVYEAVRETFPDADEHTAYGTDIIETIFETVSDVEASAIAYRSRGGSRLLHFLSGDLTIKLVTNSPVPVVALPDPDESSERS